MQSIFKSEFWRNCFTPLNNRGGGIPIIASVVTLIVLAGVLSASAFGANPAEEMTKTTTVMGGSDPHGDSWASIQHSILQFSHVEFVLRLFLSMVLAVACAWVVAWHPRRPSILDPMSDIEERKTIILLGMVGAVVAELAGNSSPLAFVIFGVGALLRFRTVLNNPKMTVKAITVVVIGLACGMGSWVMAVFVTAFSWLLLYYLESHVSCRMRVRLGKGADVEAAFGVLQALLVTKRCQLHRSELYESKGEMVFYLYVPAGIDPRQFESEVQQRLPGGAAEVSFRFS